MVASVPVHRREIHLKKFNKLPVYFTLSYLYLRLLSQGHRVGIVDQIETAALKKVSDNRNTVFERKLVKLVTAAT
jgi:DNA mismatch repair protein MSH3